MDDLTTPVWTCGRCGTALRPRPGQLVAAMKAHAETCVTTSEQQARAFSRAVFVDGEISLGDFMTRLAEYGDARVREALAQRERMEAAHE